MSTSNPPLPAISVGETLVPFFDRLLQEERDLAAETHGCTGNGTPWRESVRRLFGDQSRQLEAWVDELSRWTGHDGRDPLQRDCHEESRMRERPLRWAERIVAQHDALAGEVRDLLEAVYQRGPLAGPTERLRGLISFHETSAWVLRLALSGSEEVGRSRGVPRRREK